MTVEERLEKLESAMASAWDAIGTLAGNMGSLTRSVDQLTATVQRLSERIDRFIAAQQDGQQDGD